MEQAAERIIGNYLLRREQNTTSRIEYSQEDLPSLFESKKTAKRTLKAVPGIAKTAMIHDGTPVFTIIQAKHHPNGTGKLHLYGFVDTFQKDHVRIAYEYARRTAQIDFNKIDIAVCITNPIPATADNYLGMAAYMAILSDLTGKTIPEDALFLGGCDLYGNMFWDGPALGPIVDHIKHSGKTNIYGPLELAEYAPKHCDLNLVQSFDAAILFEII